MINLDRIKQYSLIIDGEKDIIRFHNELLKFFDQPRYTSNYHTMKDEKAKEAEQVGFFESGGTENYITGLDYFHAAMGEKEWRKWGKWLKKQERKKGRSILSVCMESVAASVYRVSSRAKRIFQDICKSFNKQRK